MPGYHITNSCNYHYYRLEKEIITDPTRDTLLQRIQFFPTNKKRKDFKLFMLLAPHLGNAGAGNTAWIGNVSLIARFQDLQQWTRIRKGLEGSRLVRDLNVESLSVSGADITFAFAGRPEQLAADLRSRGVDLSNANGGWEYPLE